jgi:hypothetical protein
LKITKDTYRRELWSNQPAYVEVWLEKDALAGVLYQETEPWDVPLMVTRGYSSISYLHAAADAMASIGKPVFVYYFGDHDPSGRDITRATEAGLREFAGDAEIHFERVAVTEEQIMALHLPTRPTKKTDSRCKSFQGRSVEVDAIPPAVLRALARECIQAHIDEHRLQQIQMVEELERKTLERILLSPELQLS